MKNSTFRTILKIAIAIVLILNFIVLTSCGSRRGWSCKKRYVNTSEQVQENEICKP